MIYLKESVLTLAFDDVLQSKTTCIQQRAYRENVPQRCWILTITEGLKYGCSVYAAHVSKLSTDLRRENNRHPHCFIPRPRSPTHANILRSSGAYFFPHFKIQ